MKRKDLKDALTNANVRAFLLEKKPAFLHVIYWMFRVLLQIASLAQQLHVRISTLPAESHREYVIQMKVAPERLSAARTSSALKLEKPFNNIRRKSAPVIVFFRASVLLVDALCARPLGPILRASIFHFFRMICLPFAESCTFFLWVVSLTLSEVRKSFFVIFGVVFCNRCASSFNTLSKSFGIGLSRLFRMHIAKLFAIGSLPFFVLRVDLFSVVFLPLFYSFYRAWLAVITGIAFNTAALFASVHRGILI